MIADTAGSAPRHDTGDVDDGVALLRTTTAIRERAAALVERARGGGSRWFTVDDDARAAAADEVASVTRQRYPDLDIPFHSRWRHFETGGVDRLAAIDDRLPSDPAERVRSLTDLAVISVLLDAGAGPDWTFHETVTGLRIARSEGLAVASWHAFVAGLFSSDPRRPLQVDATALQQLTPESLGAAFQASATNPLVGVDGRVELLRRLGAALTTRPHVFGTPGRPGHLLDFATSSPRRSVAATDILAALLRSLSGIWLSGNSIDGHPLGDCWRHDAVTGPGATDGWMPFHKLSQWLTFSLLEPLAWAGVDVTGIDELTPLPEYRNGGLLLDTGVIELRDQDLAHEIWSPGDELIVEWRALTVGLIDELAPLVRDALGGDREKLPLACVLEGGTWAAGRVLAGRLRNGLPPLTVASDGTVF
ncbi:URC4/urg3 family protein [Gordonia hankookensis]|uniref:URC4/urg3 family protein n=1 Tax=Gordonia hankookensis TaxID=589403 RepID=A0ABR7WH22_9ACTN|nr:URC4/urg3 family protein [Gordonia hankookensis]MBD1322071.1 URC4/urg3 family protein [Gordonia hankookensis]